MRAEPRDEVDDRPEFADRGIDALGAGVELFAGARRKQFRLVGRICDLALIGLQADDIFLEPAEFADLAVHLIGRQLDAARSVAAPDGELAAVARDRLGEYLRRRMDRIIFHWLAHVPE